MSIKLSPERGEFVELLRAMQIILDWPAVPAEHAASHRETQDALQHRWQEVAMKGTEPLDDAEAEQFRRLPKTYDQTMLDFDGIMREALRLDDADPKFTPEERAQIEAELDEHALERFVEDTQ